MIRGILLTTGWLLVILVVYLSLTPAPPAPMTFENSDKVEHALAYATLSFWFCQVYPRQRVWVMVSLVGLGVALEYVQGWTGYRTFDVMDMLADSVGVLLGWLLVQTPLGHLLDYIEKRLTR